ncbi:MAG: glycosyl hydrolase family 18 protein [Bacteroidia bacterium]|nr:glycosyl hydrolase family 18 protein [Bacteroidia bacterium]
MRVSLTLILSTALLAQSEFLSIHQWEAEIHRPYAHFTERQWDSVNNYRPPAYPAFRQSSNCTLRKQVMGYHPYWAGTAFNSYQWNLLSTVVFFSYEVDPATGNYSNPTVINTWRSTSLVQVAHQHGTQVQLCATLFGGNNLTTFLTSAVARRRCIDSLISLIAQRNADGINIDFEGLPSAQRNNFTSFIRQLRDSLNRRRPTAKLSVALPAVDWGNAFDLPALSALCDQLFIMGYDFYWRTATTAGPTGLLHVGQIWGSRCNSRTLVDYLANGAARHKLILGVPYYGFRYPTSTNTYPASTTGEGVARTYAQAYNEANTYGWNWEPQSRSRYFMYQSGGQWYQTWWHDSLSLAWIYRTALMQDIGGVGMWALSYDGNRSELWGALRDHFTNCAVIACRDTFFDMGGTHGAYFNRENWTWTLAPTGASSVTVVFDQFQLENGYDTLWIYNGPSTSSPLIGAYTGTNSPGTVVGTTGSLTFRYKSDNATTAPGWLARWSCVLDNTPPLTTIGLLRPWYGRSFSVSFSDVENQGSVQGYVCVADYDGSRWGANPARGFAYEDFPGTALPPGWTAQVGTWSVSDNTLIQSNESEGNTNLYFPLTQEATGEWLYTWRLRLGGSGTNRRAGLHIFASDPTQTQRGNSYLLWFRLDNQRIEIYRITNNTLPTPQYQQPYNFVANRWYDIKATYKPATGEIRIWIDNQLAATWTDPNPLTSGGWVSLRTGNAIVGYAQLRVYRSRGSTFQVEVGPNGHARYESPSLTQPAVRLLALSVNSSGLWSAVAQAEAGIDLTPPTASLSVSGWKTQDYTQAFTESDALSGINLRFFLPTFFTGESWRAQAAAGFLYDDFAASVDSWSAGAGTWQVADGALLQTDATQANTSYTHPVAQGARHFYRVRARLTNTTGNRRWGFHILADNSTQANRGNSYLIWLRYDQQDLQIYETVADVLHTRQTVPLTLNPDTDYLVEVLYDEGYLAVWVNGRFVAQWTDPTPLTGGGYLSLRTNQAQVTWDFVEVWGSRPEETVQIMVGPTGFLAAQSPAPTRPAGRLYSRVMDWAENLSPIAEAEVLVDWTPPTAPAQVRDGTGPTDEDLTQNPTELAANWEASEDPHSGVVEYEYAIGTAAGSTDVVDWTATGSTALAFTRGGLNLIEGQTYYIGVRAKNGAELTGPATWSNGIRYQRDVSTASVDLASPGPLRLYPNPTSGRVVIEVLRPSLAQEGYLLDAAGRTVARFPLSGGTTVLELGGLAAGPYWVWVPPYSPLRLVLE